MAGADVGRTAAARAALAAAVVAALVLALAGCSQGDASTSTTQQTTTQSAGPDHAQINYAALGDSYTAAPFVSVTDLAGGCFRASRNYPFLVARRLAAHLHDVSCGGASTDDISGRQDAPDGSTHPPQIRAIGPRTRLVTVGIGGNDDSLFRTILRACLGWKDGPSATPSPVPPGSCTTGLQDELGDPATLVDGIGDNVARALHLVHRRAPRAVVVLVGYPRLLDPEHPCPGVPLSATDRVLLARIQSRLSTALARAAHSSGAEYVDMRRLSRGHEICSADPWINGPVTDKDRALAFHPFEAEQQAVASAVVDLVGKQLSPTD